MYQSSKLGCASFIKMVRSGPTYDTFRHVKENFDPRFIFNYRPVMLDPIVAQAGPEPDD